MNFAHSNDYDYVMETKARLYKIYNLVTTIYNLREIPNAGSYETQINIFYNGILLNSHMYSRWDS